MATFQNKATLSYSGRTTDSNTVIGNITEALSVTKTALGGEYTNNSRLTYIVSLINSGTTDITGLTVVDDLGGYTVGAQTVYPLDYVEGSLAYYINGVPQTVPNVVSNGTLTVTGISVRAGGNSTLIYQADVTEFAPLGVGASITNIVSVNGLLADDVVASETVNVLEAPELTISKFLSPTNVTENGALTYTFVIQNVGNTEAGIEDNAVVTDIFDPILSITAVTLNGSPLTLDVGYTYDETTGEFRTADGAITVPAATYTQQEDGSYVINPGVATLTVSGTI